MAAYHSQSHCRHSSQPSQREGGRGTDTGPAAARREDWRDRRCCQCRRQTTRMAWYCDIDINADGYERTRRELLGFMSIRSGPARPATSINQAPVKMSGKICAGSPLLFSGFFQVLDDLPSCAQDHAAKSAATTGVPLRSFLKCLQKPHSYSSLYSPVLFKYLMH